MTELTVIDTGSDDLAGKIVSGIREYGGLPDVRVVQAASFLALKNRTPDILVLSEEASKICDKAPGCVKCGILLLPGDLATGGQVSCDAEGFDAGCIITYGMSPKNTITLSSIGEESCVLAIQREFLTVRGDMMERQEMKVRGGLRPSSLLAVAGALLILGLKLSAS
jgi:hypothetical protein